MEVMRNMTIDTELFELGDIISFTLTTGEKIKAKAIRETPNGMLIISDEWQPYYEREVKWVEEECTGEPGLGYLTLVI